MLDVGQLILRPTSITLTPLDTALLGIGFSYAVGIILAISICGPVSGAHLSPAVTIAATLSKGFPPLKAVRYVIAQVLGAFIACLVIYVQYHDQIKELTLALEAQGVFDRINFTPQGIAGSFAFYPPVGSSLRYIFFNEFVCVSTLSISQSPCHYLFFCQTFILGLVIWACVDPTNFYVPTSCFSVVIALGYAMIIWGYAPIGLAANTARDVGARMMAVAIWGSKANGGTYAAISALTNILATWVSLIVYNGLLADSSRGTKSFSPSRKSWALTNPRSHLSRSPPPSGCQGSRGRVPQRQHLSQQFERKGQRLNV